LQPITVAFGSQADGDLRSFDNLIKRREREPKVNKKGQEEAQHPLHATRQISITEQIREGFHAAGDEFGRTLPILWNQNVVQLHRTRYRLSVAASSLFRGKFLTMTNRLFEIAEPECAPFSDVEPASDVR
jgi:hypothetical protein